MADSSTCLPLVPQSVTDAHTKIKEHIHRTPLLTSKTINDIASSPDPAIYLSDSIANPSKPFDSEHTDGVPKFNLFFKCENFQRIGAFKARGAFYAITRLIDTMTLPVLREKGVITHSSGNHAQALSLAAHTFKVPSYVVMPQISTSSKVLGAKRYAKEVIFSGSTSHEREAAMAQVQARTGAIFVPPFDHPDIVLGQGTVGREMSEQFQELLVDEKAQLDAVLSPIGGGGLLAGIATWFSDKETTVFGAEPSFQGADDAKRGRRAGSRITSVRSLTIADGLRMPVGLVNWEIVRDKKKVEEIYSVSEDEIKMTMRLVLERMKLVVEPSACTTLAVVLFNPDFRRLVAESQNGRPWNVGVVFSGGNTTVKIISTLFADDDASPKEKS
ncbi:threonine dehydratase [Capronia epimyces CBS 606.96]|uniref:Threonine dehydratase n=1 Tax=Capronia epimyces CBS 606.96 TaxID=1182542 RepID=W9YAM0_9EURO|nr:threonine dehydratase [Capronia epimyces CBS 606.96]EXJ79409.1 threonine dehydratase [Capronia epimyces CBS 606.96]